MTPAIDLAEASSTAYTVHSYQHDPHSQSYGTEAAEQLGLTPDQVFKTLVTTCPNGELIVGIVPVSKQLNLKALASAAGVKKIEMADKQKVQRVTGYLLGGVSPIAQKKPLRTFLDSSANKHATIYVSAGRRGLEIELSAADLCRLTNASYADIASS
ncbi:Cys-tRNA(Pro) deacylase [Arenicella xantha]|uniref:Cys-tRNA(Pro)/Cys-tRNA(Cys) deacylase n=1 Tax=Arenicella xantha TaxID=644221 RepID=A0A395JNA7_9GAMM|nr:Cys-tRNA(Pro) deacylase [Arenicella xantha]RBP49384.1 Cys-tRNA(Pro)/Cys-tRNA(Cys) deacylase [Arenicella xantha]